MAVTGKLYAKDSEIIELYLGGFSSRKIAKQYGVTGPIVLKLLRRNNIELRPSSNLNGKSEDIVKDYLAGSRDDELLDRYKVGSSVLNRVLDSAGITKRFRGDSIRRRYVDQSYFDNIDCESKAYYLGLLFADGYNHQKSRTIKIGLHVKDEKTIRSFREAIKSERSLYYEKNLLVLCFNSIHISRRLADIGCIQGKSLTCPFPDCIDNSLLHHFVRGYFDGDGHIGNFKKHKSSVINVVGSSAFVQEVGHLFQENCSVNVNYRKHWQTKGIWYVEVGGALQVKRVVNYLYKDASIYMDRKKQRADYLLSDKYNSPRIIGSMSVNAKLTEDQVVLIKRMIRDGKSVRQISLDFGVTASCISLIKRGKNWKHVISDDRI